MKAELIPSNGDPPIPITRDITVVGRKDYCDVRIEHPGLSKRHCVLVRTDGLLVVRDLASTNGTKVNGQKVRWAALLPNDRLSFGTYKVRVYLGSDDAPSPSEILAAKKGVAGQPAPAKPAPGSSPPIETTLPLDSDGKPAAPDRSPLPLSLPVGDDDDLRWPVLAEPDQDDEPLDDLIIELD